MKKVEMYWLNDTNQTQNIYFNTLNSQDLLHIVAPTDLVKLTFEINDNQIPLVKLWASGVVLIWGQNENVFS